MTALSTVTTLLAHEAASPPLLRRFMPLFRGGELERRKVTMVPDVLDWLEAPVRSDAIAKAKAAARAHIAQFIKGEKIDDLHFMKRIEDRRRKPSSFDHQVWAFRPLFNPQHRYFGVFATKDWFVVCTKQSRDRLAEHDNRWHKEIDKTSRI